MTDIWISPADTHTETEMIADWNKLCSKDVGLTVSCRCRQGMLLLENFQPHIWETEGPNGKSISKLWNNADLRAKVLERTAKHKKTIYKSEIRRNLAFYSHAPLPTMYRPLLTKGIVTTTSAMNVLDPCIGWGGRMLGTLCVEGSTFTGCEPSTRTFAGLQAMAALCGVADRAFLHCAGAEDVLPTLASGEYDMVLTSPPYFTLEVYCHEDTQSVKKFATWEQWVMNWLDPVIRECLRCLKPTGVSAWSVKNMPKYKLKDAVFAIHKKYGWAHDMSAGMTATARNTGTTSNAGTTAKLTEETFLFHKISFTGQI